MVCAGVSDKGLDHHLVQCNVSFNKRKGTLRGLHYQIPPYAEVKLVRCTKGSLFDVVVDLRPQSPAHKRWFGVGLTEDNGKMIYVPEGFARGYMTLVDNTEMNYYTSKFNVRRTNDTH